MFAVKTLDAIETGFDRGWDNIIRSVQARMSQNRNPAGLVNKGDSICSRHLEFRNPGWPMLLQKTLKCFVHRCAIPCLDECSRNVRSPRRSTARYGHYRLNRNGHLLG